MQGENGGRITDNGKRSLIGFDVYRHNATNAFSADEREFCPRRATDRAYADHLLFAIPPAAAAYREAIVQSSCVSNGQKSLRRALRKLTLCG